VLLFKYSALTFNGHRIHYDRDYARDVEAYPELVVQGPLTALLLAELAREEWGRPLVEFSFRARAPFYVGDRLRLRGEPQSAGRSVQLMAYRPDGKLAMTAEAG
jgi:3-methylfumaryl-CoA hydratase